MQAERRLAIKRLAEAHFANDREECEYLAHRLVKQYAQPPALALHYVKPDNGWRDTQARRNF